MKNANDTQSKDARRLDYLESLLMVGTAKIAYNDDPDSHDEWGDVPLGFSIRIRACENEDHVGSTLRECMDAAMEIEDLAHIVDENAELFRTATVCFNCRRIHDGPNYENVCQECGTMYDESSHDTCPKCGSTHHDLYCAICHSTDVECLDRVLAEWDQLVEDVEKKDLIEVIRNYINIKLKSSEQER